MYKKGSDSWLKHWDFYSIGYAMSASGIYSGVCIERIWN